MFVEPVHLHPFYALIDCGQQKQETRQCGSQYGACEWDTSDQRSRMMTRSVRVLCSWLRSAHHEFTASVNITFLGEIVTCHCRNYVLRTFYTQCPSNRVRLRIIPLNCYSFSQKATPTDSNVAPTGQSEPAATNAPVPSSVEWMGCFSSFDARWGSS